MSLVLSDKARVNNHSHLTYRQPNSVRPSAAHRPPQTVGIPKVKGGTPAVRKRWVLSMFHVWPAVSTQRWALAVQSGFARMPQAQSEKLAVDPAELARQISKKAVSFFCACPARRSHYRAPTSSTSSALRLDLCNPPRRPRFDPPLLPAPLIIYRPHHVGPRPLNASGHAHCCRSCRLVIWPLGPANELDLRKQGRGLHHCWCRRCCHRRRCRLLPQ